jgi:hypothetical protein
MLLSPQSCSKLGEPVAYRVTFLDVPHTTGAALEGIQIR